MIRKKIKVKNKLGLHARPCSMLVKELSVFQSKVKIIKDDMEVNGKSIMGVMMLAAEQGAVLEFVVDGPDEEMAFTKISELFKNKFGEE